MRWTTLGAVGLCLAMAGLAVADDEMGHVAPQSVTATCGATSASVSWSAVSDSRLLGYDVYERASGSPDYTKANGAVVTTTVFTVTGLSTGVAYDFAVVTVYTDGASSLSTPASCTTG